MRFICIFLPAKTSSIIWLSSSQCVSIVSIINASSSAVSSDQATSIFFSPFSSIHIFATVLPLCDFLLPTYYMDVSTILRRIGREYRKDEIEKQHQFAHCRNSFIFTIVCKDTTFLWNPTRYTLLLIFIREKALPCPLIEGYWNNKNCHKIELYCTGATGTGQRHQHRSVTCPFDILSYQLFCSKNYEKHRGAASRQGARSPREWCLTCLILSLASANIVTWQ